ncbi:hypothetical protein E2C01_061496 [Portunus trituberculatus]|uniref:Pacifastin domain-containing protein n=1 Tax=Portunus trituberculatus TaxID=210409 RepID=A0A5B7H8A1_PORTR|nr:hypothetical protein [Portunus trituberculatus]
MRRWSVCVHNPLAAILESLIATRVFPTGTSVPPKPETVACEVELEGAESGWLVNCHWCTCVDGSSVCKLEAACVNDLFRDDQPFRK